MEERLTSTSRTEEMSVDYLSIFSRAAGNALKDIKIGRFTPEGERDLQALVFHHVVALLDASPATLYVHADPARFGDYPDLVLGDDALFIELKMGKRATGGYTHALKEWSNDIQRLRKYKSKVPRARCVFLGLDQSNYLSNAASINFFDPGKNGLLGAWQRLNESTSYLITEVKT